MAMRHVFVLENIVFKDVQNIEDAKAATLPDDKEPNTLYVFKTLDHELIAKWDDSKNIGNIQVAELGNKSSLNQTYYLLEDDNKTLKKGERWDTLLASHCQNFINCKQAEFNEPAIPQEKRIENFFGTKFLNAYKGLEAAIESKRQEVISINSMQEPKKSIKMRINEYQHLTQAIKQFDNLKKILSANTPRLKISPQAAANNIGLIDIHAQISELKETLKLTTCGQKAGRFILQMLDAIVVALGGAYYGAQYGGAAAGPYGAIGGAIAASLVGLFAINKVGTWLSHKSSTIAGADHSANLLAQADKSISPQT